MARKPYTHQVERAKDLVGLIHTDVCGPFKIMSRKGASYFITFTDDFSCYGYVYLLKHKHEVFETFKVFQKEVENQLGKTIKSLRSDRGGKYMSQEFLDHLKDHGIIAHRTPPYTPQHNGVSERRNRTLLDMVRSMMSQTTLPKSFWDYALETATRILNMVPTKKVEKTPYERDTLTKPDKLEPRAIKCIFVGYPKETMGYSFYYPPENKVLVARNAEFIKNSLIDQEASGSGSDWDAEYALPKLLQIGTVSEYQNEFQMLINRETRISESLLKSFYISRLRVTLQIELLRAMPTTLAKGFSLACITEARFEDKRSTTAIAKPNDLNTGVQILDLEKTIRHKLNTVEADKTSRVVTSKENKHQENQDSLNEISKVKDNAKPPISANTFDSNGGDDSETPCTKEEVIGIGDVVGLLNSGGAHNCAQPNAGTGSEVVSGLSDEFQEGDMVHALLRVVDQKSSGN
nr:retrotransposon protein, putative, Ty1-copia subclass [Tanacetum cinerariifolium]